MIPIRGDTAWIWLASERADPLAQIGEAEAAAVLGRQRHDRIKPTPVVDDHDPQRSFLPVYRDEHRGCLRVLAGVVEELFEPLIRAAFVEVHDRALAAVEVDALHLHARLHRRAELSA